ncbi:hypothetical protein BKA66DRAFT_570263 [Pyrenochaeta sp. MPI-SDFR-AT-0127]|nr:hypothetical protein BKA66DRAFT_570263 [Pyrenochaeta sp. MPI-SDFR-AT-0127]
MMLSAFFILYWSSIVTAGVLDVRQLQCSEDDCYRAVWGDQSLPRVVEAVTDCQSYLTTTVIVHPITTVTVVTKTTSNIATLCPTPPEVATISLLQDKIRAISAQVAKKAEVRQVSSTDWLTTTLYGLFPPYATPACVPTNYVSACSCVGISQSEITYLGTVS